MATLNDFDKLEIRVGKIINVEPFPEAHQPAWKLTIDFGEKTGIKKSSARLTENYSKDQLMNQMILGVTNFPPLQIGPFKSEVLVLGVPDTNGNTILVVPEKNVRPGARLY
ncbi:MAG: tRNA-binding protein [Bacteroidetes bacterium]|nr:tRNA-binding protein [Bacteroidota bacterium]